MTTAIEAARILARMAIFKAMAQAINTEREAKIVIERHQYWSPIPALPKEIRG